MELVSTAPLHKKVAAALDRLRPALVADGCNIELVDIQEDGTVRVAFQGACTDCPAQFASLRIGIEEPLRDAVPGVTSVISI
jgi:Fe-S cluster biogenesis protein NfuA